MPQMSPCLWFFFSFTMFFIMLFMMTFIYFSDKSTYAVKSSNVLTHKMKWTW